MAEAVRVLCGASVRRAPDVLNAHVLTLQQQILPPDTTLDFCHVDDFLRNQREAGREALGKLDGVLLNGEPQSGTEDFDDSSPVTHSWQLTSFQRVAANKQKILDYAIAHHYTHVWICDTDLLLDPYTLASMLAVSDSKVSIIREQNRRNRMNYVEGVAVAAVYWTRWQPNSPAQPQVWLRHPYELQGRGMDMFEFRRRLRNRQITRVYGLGACMLVNTEILKAGVRYSPLLPELVQGAQEEGNGMLAGEDRTFCTLAERRHIQMWADPWPDIFHIYRPEDAAAVPGYMENRALRTRNRPIYPDYGDDVNLQILPLEDPHVGPQSVRGRVGQLRLLPDLERAVRLMRRGDRRMVDIAFPVDYELAQTGSDVNPPVVPYRGKRKVVEIYMIDHRPHGYPPVLGEDTQPADDWTFYDTFSYTPSQQEALLNARREKDTGS